MNPETIKKHFAEHKEVYIGIGIGLTLAGITWVIVRGRNTSVHGALGSDLHGGSEDSLTKVREAAALGVKAPDALGVFGSHGNVNSRAFNFFSTQKISADTTVNLYTGHRGHPGFVTRCVETNEVFSSMQNAAHAFDIPYGIFCSRLKNGLAEIDGLHFERLNLAD